MADEDKIYRDLGERIRSFRRRAKLSQLALGKLLGVTFQQVQKYETGANKIPFHRLLEIAELVGVELYELAGLDTPKALGKTISTEDLATLCALSSMPGGDAVREIILAAGGKA
jgi:transcriptional regulator with XRE-family HTH domain